MNVQILGYFLERHDRAKRGGGVGLHDSELTERPA